VTSSPYLTTEEVAEITSRSTRTVQQWCEEGRVRAIRVRSKWRIYCDAFGIAAPPMPRRPSWRVNEVADWLRISRQSVWRLIQDGELAVVRRWSRLCIERDSLLAYIQRAMDTEAA